MAVERKVAGNEAASFEAFSVDPVATFDRVRSQTLALCRPLEVEDYGLQSMPEASPPKWHIAHTTWFFETFLLAQADPRYRPFHDAFGYLFNSYYETVGRMHPRPQRGILTRPTLAAVRAYREAVDRRVTALLGAGALSNDELSVVELGLHHEQQHQELILTDIKHGFWSNPLRPAYRPSLPKPLTGSTPALEWVDVPGGVARVGHVGEGFAFDNETPSHRVFIEPFALASRLITCGEYLEFMADGGYERPELWLSEGWEAVRSLGWIAPLYWERAVTGAPWSIFTLEGMRDLDPNEPVVHLSYFEADAYARWTGFRLPIEAEWEVACRDRPVTGNFLESDALHVAPPIGSQERNDAATAAGTTSNRAPILSQAYGDAWEWTSSAYAPYRGYRVPAGALGEYNGKFMSGQMVLRGGSCASPRSHLRPTYRNFFPPHARWQFSGIRLARDL
jgi:ergothioneine biosynthesis protein EgtB